jgi:hypothetical protein
MAEKVQWGHSSSRAKSRRPEWIDISVHSNIHLNDLASISKPSKGCVEGESSNRYTAVFWQRQQKFVVHLEKLFRKVQFTMQPIQSSMQLNTKWPLAKAMTSYFRTEIYPKPEDDKAWMRQSRQPRPPSGGSPWRGRSAEPVFSFVWIILVVDVEGFLCSHERSIQQLFLPRFRSWMVGKSLALRLCCSWLLMQLR